MENGTIPQRLKLKWLWFMAVHMLVFPSVSISLQLRSAGAAVIQELFPRVSSIATLDISDNGTVARCRTSHHDLDFLSLGSWGWSGLLMSSCVCVCVFWQVSTQTYSQSCQPSLDTLPSNTFIWARTSTSKTGAVSALCHALLQLFMDIPYAHDCVCIWAQTCLHCICQLEYTHFFL